MDFGRSLFKLNQKNKAGEGGGEDWRVQRGAAPHSSIPGCVPSLARSPSHRLSSLPNFEFLVTGSKRSANERRGGPRGRGGRKLFSIRSLFSVPLTTTGSCSPIFHKAKWRYVL